MALSMTSTTILALLMGILSLLSATLAATIPVDTQKFPHVVRQTNATALCTPGATIPSLYTFSNLRVVYAAGASSIPSSASFTITNNLTNSTEPLSCTLRIGYQCQFNGTPKNPALQVWLQLNLAAYFSFLETTTCPAGKTTTVTGAAEMWFTCPDTPIENGQTCVGDLESVKAPGGVDATAP